MASPFIWVGILFLVLAVIGHIFPVSDTTMDGQAISVTIPEAIGICDSAMSQMGQAYSAEAVKTCSEYRNLMMGLYGSALLGILLVIVGVAKPSKSKGKKNESEYTCGYCKYVAKSERELYNHSLDCEAYKEKHSSLDILKARYAKGEITKGEFDDMKNNLEK